MTRYKYPVLIQFCDFANCEENHLKTKSVPCYIVVLYNAMSRPEPPGHSRYEILKIWIPTHGVVNIYRNPRGGEFDFCEVFDKRRDLV